MLSAITSQECIAIDGYSRLKNPPVLYLQSVTLEELKQTDSFGYPRLPFSFKVLDHNGKARDIRANGKLKLWKTRPLDASLPMKYGMYEAFTVDIRDGMYTGEVLYKEVKRV